MGEIFWYFLRLGWLAFGGPLGQIGLMHLDVVERRKWLDEDEFVRALNFCHVLPGPEALQLAIYIGYKKRGYLAGALAGFLFILPGFITLTVLAWIYVRFGKSPQVLAQRRRRGARGWRARPAARIPPQAVRWAPVVTIERIGRSLPRCRRAMPCPPLDQRSISARLRLSVERLMPSSSYIAMGRGFRWTAIVTLLLAACRAIPPPGATVVALPDGRPGIGFDDLRFSSTYGVLAPGGRSGNLDLVDPASHAVTAVGGFSMEPFNFGGHDQGATSADEGGGFIFVTDRTTGKLALVDPRAHKIVATAPVAAIPDYVRYVPQTHELWVTEPDAEQIEVFALVGNQPMPAARIATPGGPESLVIDTVRDRAYAHQWAGGSISVDVHARAVVAQWTNGCSGSRGIALDSARGLLFAGCVEGRGTVADVTSGTLLATLDVPARGVDVIDYAPALGHLYLPGQSNATLAIVGVAAAGQLTLLGTTATVGGAHCVAADDRGNAWVCDPDNGDLLVIADTMPRSGG